MPPKKRKSAPKSKTPRKSKQQKNDENITEEDVSIENNTENNDLVENDDSTVKDEVENIEETVEVNKTDSFETEDGADLNAKRPQKLLVHEIVSDPLTLISLDYWAPNSPKNQKPFNKDLIEKIFNEEIVAKNYDLSRIMLLELSFYLEK